MFKKFLKRKNIKKNIKKEMNEIEKLREEAIKNLIKINA